LSLQSLDYAQINYSFNLLTPNDHYSGRTATLNSEVAFYIFESSGISTDRLGELGVDPRTGT